MSAKGVVLVVLEHQSGKWNRMSFEALAAGAQLASVLGTSVEAAALGEFSGSVDGAEKLYVLKHELLADYTPDGFSLALEQLINAINPAAVLFPHTYQVRDYAPKLATRFGQALVSDVVAIQNENGSVALIRQLFQGKLNASIKPAGEPQFISVQAGAFRAEPNGSTAALQPFAVELNAAQIRSKPEPPFRESQRSVDLGKAAIIVSVGRGIKEKDNIAIVEELAKALGGELAASRPICDNGWLPMERQVGSSGQTVAPAMYLAVGISGAIQHLVGMKGSKTVVAINHDENAPIFETADYGIVGDLFEVVPVLTEEIRKAKS